MHASNNKSNFLASLLEVTFAHQFETAGVSLDYEVRQEPDQPGTIDFRMTASSGDAVYFELRLLQQDEKMTADIAKQLAAQHRYAVAMDGEGERDAVVRLQGAVLQKVARKDGTPIKFAQAGSGVVNIVVVGVSDLLLGTVDAWDCVLAACGDSAVPAECRRGVVGLFQASNAGDPPEMQARVASFAHIRATLHGLLFVFRAAGAGVLDHRLELSAGADLLRGGADAAAGSPTRISASRPEWEGCGWQYGSGRNVPKSHHSAQITTGRRPTAAAPS